MRRLGTECRDFFVNCTRLWNFDAIYVCSSDDSDFLCAIEKNML